MSAPGKKPYSTPCACSGNRLCLLHYSLLKEAQLKATGKVARVWVPGRSA